MASGLASYDAKVILHGRDVEKAREAAMKLANQGFDVGHCTFDVADANAVENGIRAISEEDGPIDILAHVVLRTWL